MKNIVISILVGLFLISCSDRDLPKVKDLSELSKTSFMITPKDSIKEGSNAVYCTTLGYAWAEIDKALNHDIQIDDSVHYLKQLHNSKTYENSLAESEIDVGYQINELTIKASAKFKKSLSFETEFERNSIPLVFDEKEVESFGLKDYESDIAKQIHVLFYESDEEFAIRLNPEEEEHEILLYMPKNKDYNNLEECSASFNKQLLKHTEITKTEENTWRYDFNGIDELSIPVFEFNLETNFEKLEGELFNTTKAPYEIEVTYQRIGLLLDEKGAEIESESWIGATCTEAFEEVVEPTPKHLVFNKPFLIQFKRRDSKNPYLVAWISNTELMTLKK